MSEIFDFIRLPEGTLEIIVQDHITQEVTYRQKYKNQIQDWLKNALAYLSAGRMFCTWGHHGETIDDGTGTSIVSRVDHYIDGSSTDMQNSTPWTFNNSFSGLVQKRDNSGQDIDSDEIGENVPLYPFFPTKMRFGTGGLDGNLQPISDTPTDQKTLNVDGNPFVLVDRQRTTDHITISQSGGVTNNKVTFSVKLPGGDPNYPYNGKVLSEAGLYCDAALRVGESNLEMRTGMLLAYRTFHGITKNESSDVTFHWSWTF